MLPLLPRSCGTPGAGAWPMASACWWSELKTHWREALAMNRKQGRRLSCLYTSQLCLSRKGAWGLSFSGVVRIEHVVHWRWWTNITPGTPPSSNDNSGMSTEVRPAVWRTDRRPGHRGRSDPMARAQRATYRRGSHIQSIGRTIKPMCSCNPDVNCATQGQVVLSTAEAMASRQPE